MPVTKTLLSPNAVRLEVPRSDDNAIHALYAAQQECVMKERRRCLGHSAVQFFPDRQVYEVTVYFDDY